MKIFFDMEFTGLHKDTTLISIGCVAENGREFYAELTDFDEDQCDDWIKENVIANLLMHSNYEIEKNTVTDDGILGDKDFVKDKLTEWLESFDEQVEMWSDVYAYDWVLFCDIWGHAFDVPKCVYYIPFDIATLFQWNNIDPDVNREEFAGMADGKQKHNALWDALVIRKCYVKMFSERGING